MLSETSPDQTIPYVENNFGSFLWLVLDISVSLKDLIDCITITVCTDISSPPFVFRPQSGTVLRSEGAAFDVAQSSWKGGSFVPNSDS